MELLFYLGFFVFMLTLGFFVGGYTERSHFRRLEEREAANQGFIVTQIKSFPGGASSELPPQVFLSECVIASDYLKTFLSSIRKFFGGELKSYHTLLERARRESLLRIIEQAKAAGYDTVCNLRYETADIGGATNPQKGVVTVAMLATATAYKRK